MSVCRKGVTGRSSEDGRRQFTGCLTGKPSTENHVLPFEAQILRQLQAPFPVTSDIPINSSGGQYPKSCSGLMLTRYGC